MDGRCPPLRFSHPSRLVSPVSVVPEGLCRLYPVDGLFGEDRLLELACGGGTREGASRAPLPPCPRQRTPVLYSHTRGGGGGVCRMTAFEPAAQARHVPCTQQRCLSTSEFASR